MSKELMLINVVEEEEARVAVLEDDLLQEFYLERTGREHIVGSIYKGRVVNVEPSIEAAFVEFGYERHGFLHASDVKPSVARDSGGKNGSNGRGSRNIKKALRPGDEILVQVTKEGIGDKGPALTTYLSLPGRYLVLMPGMSLRGVSRRISDEDERNRLRKIIKDLNPPKNAGLIARTAGEGRDQREFERDMDYLGRLWKTIQRRAKKSDTPALIYQESDQIIRVIRDVFNENIRNIYVDNEDVFDRVKNFLREVMPHHVRKVKHYDGEEPLFHHFDVEEELREMHRRTVDLDCGGSIVLEQTEALVAIDVNSGQFKGSKDAEQGAYRINKEAAREIARQVRLRDLGGLVVIDFIDMEDHNHRKNVEKELHGNLSRDKARFRMLDMSPFCIVELTRQRRRRSLRQTTYVECPACHGTGQVKSPETHALEIIRRLRIGLHHQDVARVDVQLQPEVANYLNNTMRARLKELEEETGKDVQVHADPERGPKDDEIHFRRENGKLVRV
ncbi:MAG: Rne/Rng family ribonuclease [Planctomycetota bacterium]